MVRLSANDPVAALRGIIVKITFDGERCLEAPLGDVFGSAPGINPYATLPLGMTKDGEMYCHWFMPFKDSAVIELVNHSRESAWLTGELAIKDYRWTESSMHFHAKWRAQFDVPTRPMIDWNYLTAKGQGVFAGVAFAIDNPVKAWWGEGDEKIYVDGETFPSHFGTGTEDYYGYAWCWPVPFMHAYHAQPRCDGPGNYGRTSVNRFHILDRIPFTKDFKFDMELWHWDAKCKVNMAVTAYWYARPGGTDAFKPIRAEDAVVRPMPEWVVPHVAGALEGEKLRIVRVTRHRRTAGLGRRQRRTAFVVACRHEARRHAGGSLYRAESRSLPGVRSILAGARLRHSSTRDQWQEHRCADGFLQSRGAADEGN